jgi:hypothetical protein
VVDLAVHQPHNQRKRKEIDLMAEPEGSQDPIASPTPEALVEESVRFSCRMLAVANRALSLVRTGSGTLQGRLEEIGCPHSLVNVANQVLNYGRSASAAGTLTSHIDPMAALLDEVRSQVSAAAVKLGDCLEAALADAQAEERQIDAAALSARTRADTFNQSRRARVEPEAPGEHDYHVLMIDGQRDAAGEALLHATFCAQWAAEAVRRHVRMVASVLQRLRGTNGKYAKQVIHPLVDEVSAIVLTVRHYFQIVAAAASQVLGESRVLDIIDECNRSTNGTA